MTTDTFHRRLKRSSILIAVGLVLQVATLYWPHPLTFVAFILLGGTLLGVGVVLYLYSIAAR